ncbi:hypothetical protein MKK84_07920 [Methylobacterium sp. E-065]|uniref:hypothetical protein n=1 Tax=Methylobacterium sp. E-065 TaxID=2836583 RepID=UPI001FBB67C9|nr:hypothetical protein [Methylobacterium sp. E-065]MCJ2017349.1 hypothetical protein [Methylobacterium sp. E-065]
MISRWFEQARIGREPRIRETGGIARDRNSPVARFPAGINLGSKLCCATSHKIHHCGVRDRSIILS